MERGGISTDEKQIQRVDTVSVNYTLINMQLVCKFVETSLVKSRGFVEDAPRKFT